MTLEQTVAIVTGATGGLGGAVVAALLDAGAVVAAPHRRDGELAELRQRLGLGDTAALHGALVDLTDEEAVVAYYREVATSQGSVGILVNVAGGFGGGKPVHKTPWSLWQEQLDVNLKTAVLSSRAAVPHMLERGSGAIVNVSSRTAVQAGANLAAYAAAKAALLQLTDAMAEELRDQCITVNAVLPSVIDTPTNRSAMPKANHGIWVQPAAIAQVIRFLVGPEARIISGAHIPVYGNT